jgi:hypothetical protein
LFFEQIGCGSCMEFLMRRRGEDEVFEDTFNEKDE